MGTLVRLTPRSLREKLQYTDNINGIRDKCQTAEKIITDRIVPIYQKAVLDMLIYGTAVIPVEW